jgi:hypothetical protein
LQLPRTIREVIDLTAQLKFTYLWVDVLCILRGPPGYDENQVRAMDAIYHFPQVTIGLFHCQMRMLDFQASEAPFTPPAIQNRSREPDHFDREWRKLNFSVPISQFNLETSWMDFARAVIVTKMSFHRSNIRFTGNVAAPRSMKNMASLSNEGILRILLMAHGIPISFTIPDYTMKFK